MAGSIVKERKTADTPALAIGRKFNRFKNEEEKASWKTDVKESKVIEQIREIWRQFEFVTVLVPEEYGGGKTINYEMSNDRVLDLLKDFRCSAQEVAAFAVGLAELQEEKNFSDKAGFFLSALIIYGKDDDYLIPTKHLHNPISYLGRGNNGKNITVEGDVGPLLGIVMTAGTIVVNGNARSGPGTGMKGGGITVNGNVWADVGSNMEGGSITVNGNVRYNVGYGMKNGEIRLEGDYESLSSNIEGGKIFHKGRLIFSK
jgi:hypothetical protein